MGALIRADESGVPAKQVIVAIALPSVEGCLVGRGRVMRRIEAPAEGVPVSFAVAVSHYRLERRDSVLRRLPTESCSQRALRVSHLRVM
jgi:hypothetical protein